MKKLLSLIVFALFSFIAAAQVSQTVNVTTPGTLATLASAYLSTVTNLTVTGNIDARDVKTMRDDMPHLEVLDMGMVTINAYTGVATNNISTVYPANEMPQYSFYNAGTGMSKTTLKTITLPANITSIGIAALRKCTGLKGSLTLGAELSSIADYAFSACSGLKIINSLNPIPPIIGESFVFDGVSPIIVYVPSMSGVSYTTASGWSEFTITAEKHVSINVPTAGVMADTYVNGGNGFLNSVTHLTVTGNINSFDIGQMKSNMTALTSIDLSGASLASNALPANAFQNRLSITSIMLPASLQSIGDYAFDGCENLLGAIPIPVSVTSVGAYAFQNCTSLTGVLTIPAGISVINNYTFSGCSSISGALILPNTVTSIGSYAFNGCKSLTGLLTIPNSVTTLEAGVFAGCSGLSGSINIANSITSLGTSAFQNCSGFTGTLTLSNTLTTISPSAFAGCSQLTGKVDVPLSVITIGESAFKSCAKISELSVGKNLASIGNNAMNGCTSLVKISVPRTTPPTVYANTFTGIPVENCYIDVAENSIDTYKMVNYWSSFFRFTETLPVDNYIITVIKGNGGAISENNIALGNGSLLSAAIGSTKTFVITPNTGYTIATASYGDVNIKSLLVNNQFTTSAINTNATLNVTFSKEIYKISIQTGGSGAMNMSYNYGDTPSFDFTPAEGSSILSVFYNSVNVTANLVNNVYTLAPITANGTLVVNFRTLYNISMQVGANGNVTENSVTLANGATFQIASGDSKSFTFIPSTGYEVATLSYGGVDVKSAIVNNQYTTSAVIADAVLNVTFKKMQFIITVRRSATDMVNDIYEYGTTPSYDFTPAKDLKIQTVFYNDINVTADLVNNVYILPAISANANLVVNYVDKVTAIDANIDNGIKVYPTSQGIAIEGVVKNQIVTLYTLDGVQIRIIKSQGERIVTSVKAGAVYLIKTAEKSFKVIM